MSKFFKIFAILSLIINFSIIFADKPIEMPLVNRINDDEEQYGSPIEQRGPEFIRYLCVSLKISTSSGSGSGTIIFYDEEKNLAYVASCGHLWSGNMTEEEGRSKNLKCTITVWYHNEEKLNKSKNYEANIMFYSNTPGYDTSLVTFKPDWKPNYIPIAHVNYPIFAGERLRSCGCDGGNEVACYDVEIIGYQGRDLITKYNSPRPGRSGGSLISNDGYYIGTVWGTTDRAGNGEGLYTPLQSIHHIWKANNYEFLLNIRRYAQELPIIDKNNKQGLYSKDYILIPK